MGRGFKSNYYDVATGGYYWISGCKRRGGDRLYSGTVEIDPAVREEYWRDIRGIRSSNGSSRDPGKYAR